MGNALGFPIKRRPRVLCRPLSCHAYPHRGTKVTRQRDTGHGKASVARPLWFSANCAIYFWSSKSSWREIPVTLHCTTFPNSCRRFSAFREHPMHRPNSPYCPCLAQLMVSAISARAATPRKRCSRLLKKLSLTASVGGSLAKCILGPIMTGILRFLHSRRKRCRRDR